MYGTCCSRNISETTLEQAAYSRASVKIIGSRCFRPFILVALIAALFWGTTNAAYSDSRDTRVYQVSSLAALLKGEYDGSTSFGQLKKQGDFGLGTVNGLDGEVIALEGDFYQIRVDGKVIRIEDTVTTPFAVVTFFSPDKKVALAGPIDKKRLQDFVDKQLDNKDLITAVKIHGDFKSLKVRSVPKQQKPYVDLKTALEKQAVFDLSNVKGTMVGFRFPHFMGGVNVPGYHFHFISQDRTAGGHVLGCTVASGELELAELSDFVMELPDSIGSHVTSGTHRSTTEAMR